MKKIIPYILIFITVVQLFAPFTIGSVGINKAEAADGCKFVSVKYSPPSSHSNTTPDSVLLNIVTSNCVGKFFYGMVKRDGSYDATGSDGEADLSHVYYNMPSQEITSDSFSLKLIPGETSDPAMSQVEAAGG